jgi:hypothetical protein
MNNPQFHQRFCAISKAMIDNKVTVGQVYNIVTKIDTSDSKQVPDVYEIINKELKLGVDLKSIDAALEKKGETK